MSQIQTQTPSAVTTTKAWTFSRLGPYRETLQLTSSHPLPPFPPQPPLLKSNPKPEEWILIRVSYAALNPADLVLLSVLPFFLRSRPVAVPAADFTGTVIDVWSPPPPTAAAGTAGPPRFAKGDEVVCFPTIGYVLATGFGGLQGVLALPARYAVKIPPGKTKRDAAGLLLCGCTADMQVAGAGVERGQRVLVIGASGGLGSMVVQAVREKVGKEGFVVGVCSGKNKAMVVDYTQYKDLPGELARRYGDRPFDNIIDSFGNQTVYKQCSRYLKPEGVYHAASVHYSKYSFCHLLKSVMTIGLNIIWPRPRWLRGTGRKWKTASLMAPSVEMMERVVNMFGEGKLRVAVDSEWPFEKAHDAYDVLSSGHAAGKVIVRVNEEEE
ncbi:putative quinone-oxidoreductase, chloroplastic [Madurella mycetomatis]|uniref:Quinone-oxidoreductase, chloroplastic n=1 Tax=Madurella mycetomatis TaxID=100816 RepID=A0A175W5G3_9PEZI|nr:putative quinone-oxidoreductase, chloroplastic [Madurella mycetomatis]